MSFVFIYVLKDPETEEIRYVGKSKCPERRLQQHMSRAPHKTYHSANWIESLLKENKKPLMEIVERTTEEEWPERERYWISTYSNMYDLTNTSEGGLGGATYGFSGKTHRPESIQKMIEARVGVSINQNDKNGNRAAGVRNYYANNKTPIAQYETGGTFVQKWDSSMSCELRTGWNHSNLLRSCKDFNQIAYGYMWRYWDDTSGNNIEPYQYVGVKYNQTTIVQFDKKGNKLQEFPSVIKASKETNIGRTNISMCLTGKNKSAGGYVWKYQ